MTSYNLLNGIHTANSHDLIQGMLRDEWGYDGAVMIDDARNVHYIMQRYNITHRKM